MLDYLSLKFLTIKSKSKLLPNLLCLCNNFLNPQVISIVGRFILLFVYQNSHKVIFIVIYASTCYFKRRWIWIDLSTLQGLDYMPSFTGDFNNSIIGSHNHRGETYSQRNSFWLDQNNLVELLTNSALFTWSNGRFGDGFVKGVK